MAKGLYRKWGVVQMAGKPIKVCFEVRCQDCGVTFHIILASVRGVELVHCPCCGGVELQRVRERILSTMLATGGNGGKEDA